MKLEELASLIFQHAEDCDVPHMAVGAIAAGTYGIPRATKDVDLLVATTGGGIARLIAALSSLVDFDSQVQFDTITWGKRWLGTSTSGIPYKVELFEMFDDPFVISEFDRRVRTFVPILNRSIWLPTAEDVVVQKLRWARPKDLEDARDVLAVQDPKNLDLAYVEHWCAEHGSLPRLQAILEALPDFD